MLMLLCPANAQSQTTRLGKGVNFLSKYIASDHFRTLHSSDSDLALVDSLYLKALEYTKGDIPEALLFLTFATIPYNEIPLVIPGIRLRINIPLPSSKDSVFHAKNRNLPSALFFDTYAHSPADTDPETGLPDESRYGDRDKLPHFFGSAYLSYISLWFDFTKIIGIFVEEFEESFYIQSKADPRDIRADNLGNIFGKGLKRNRTLLPSQALILYPLTFFRY